MIEIFVIFITSNEHNNLQLVGLKDIKRLTNLESFTIILLEKHYYLRNEGGKMDNLIDSLKERLKEKGYKLTPQRRATLDTIIENQGKHLNTEEIYDLVKEKCPEIGLATVYRTLQLLDEMSVLPKLNLDDGCIRYELNTHEDDHQHHHLICQSCNDVIEVELDLLEHLEEEIEKKYHFTIRDHTVKFFGICSKCQ